MNINLTPPKEFISFHKSYTADQIQSYSRFKVQDAILWQKNTLLTEYQNLLDNAKIELIEYSLLCAWQNANYINYDPKDELKHPTYFDHILPAILSNASQYKISYHDDFLTFLIKRGLFSKNAA